MDDKTYWTGIFEREAKLKSLIPDFDDEDLKVLIDEALEDAKKNVISNRQYVLNYIDKLIEKNRY